SEKTDIRDENGETYLRVGSCVGYGPSDDPQIAVLIVCDEPMGDSVFGSVVAAPYVSKAMAEILPYLNIDPVYTEEELAEMEVNVSNYIGMSVTDAVNALNEKGLAFKISGDGKTITQQVPKSGSVVIQGSGLICLYTGSEAPRESVRVPDLTGYSISGATNTLTSLGLNIILKGAIQSYSSTDSYAQAIWQSVPGGTKVTPGTVVTVEFRFTDAQDG
ncbi:MAG: PASTA domain-containing protein, partial [Clostridia bacterium]|nr:PASTA domain-containing protein [Clostridia bacterium]